MAQSSTGKPNFSPMDSLPFVFASCFVENVLLAVDGKDAVLESALPVHGVGKYR